MEPTTITLDDEIQRIVASRTLRRSEQLRKLLVFLHQGTKEEDASLLSEVGIGTRLLGRKDFNPKLDTIVRSEMVRLRRKLDEYYAEEDPTATHRVAFGRNSYKLLLVERELTEPVPLVVSPPESRRSYWTGVATGAGATILLAAIAAVLWVSSHHGPSSPLTGHPLWKGFGGGQVDVLIGTPLFFRNDHGFERSFDLNFADDLAEAQKQLSTWPARPYWDLWTPSVNVGASVTLSHALENIGSKVSFLSARDESIATLAGRKTIIIGAPRYVPLLVDLLAEENFRLPPHVSGGGYTGFKNINPKPGELAEYSSPEATFEQRSDESTPDYALISRKTLPGGGEVLSVFGNRAQTAGFLTRALLDKNVLDDLNAKVFAPPAGKDAAFRSAQIVVRVDFNRGKPTGAVYVAHRIRN